MTNRYDDLVLHLKLDDIDFRTNTVSDSSNSHLTAKVQGATLVADDTFGACLNFDEQDDHVEVCNLGLSGENPAHTIEGWFKVEAYPQARSWILVLGQHDAHSHHWLLNAETAGDDMGKKAQLGVWGESINQATPLIPLAEWVHIATAYDGRNLVCYLNGRSIDRPKTTTFNLTEKRLTLAKRGPVTEKNFKGKIAHVRIYRRALAEGEIREDMDTDKVALPAYRKGHPIGFTLCDEDENYVLYIGDDPKDHHNLNLELRNTSAQGITFEKQGDQASRDNHQFELVFRNGVLSDKTLKKLRESKNEIVPKTEPWDLFSPGEDNQSGTFSVYFLYKDTSKVFGPGERLIIPLRNISADAGSGARGTRIELKLNQLTYVGEKTPITGSRIQHVQILNHLGSRRLPLHVGFAGSNRILNDGSSANTLVLQLMNVLRSEQDTSVKLTRESEFLISFDVQAAKEVAPWSLCTEKEIEGLKANDSIIVAKIDQDGNVVLDAKGNPVSDAERWDLERTDHGQGESPVWRVSPKQDMVLKRDDYIQIQISNIKTSLPSGVTNLYLDYHNIPGFWDGQVVCAIEKAPLLFYEARDQGRYTGELRVGIGSVNPEAKLEIVMTPKDTNTMPLVIRKDKVNYLTVSNSGEVGIGTADPDFPLEIGEMTLGDKISLWDSGLGDHFGFGIQPYTLQIHGNVRASRIAFGYGSSESFTETMRIQGDGKVGIGTMNPQASLDVDGEIRANGDFFVTGKVGIGTPSPGAKLSIKDGGLNVGGHSDPGNNNLHVEGKLDVGDSLTVGGMAYMKYCVVDDQLIVGNEDGRRIRISGRMEGVDWAKGAACILVEQDHLIFRTHNSLSNWFTSVEIHPPGGDVPTLAVAGHISEVLDIIPVASNQNDWTKRDHPVVQYFVERLKGKPSGTILRAITDLPPLQGYYWTGWVDSGGRIHVTQNLPQSKCFV